VKNSKTMHRFPYINEEVNRVFGEEKSHLDYLLLRPLILVVYFFTRIFLFPIKFVFHRVPYGFEAYAIDWWMSVGMKYLARHVKFVSSMASMETSPLIT